MVIMMSNKQNEDIFPDAFKPESMNLIVEGNLYKAASTAHTLSCKPHPSASYVVGLHIHTPCRAFHMPKFTHTKEICMHTPTRTHTERERNI